MANDFSGDANVQGLWTFEDYTVDTDNVADTSGNSNTLDNIQDSGYPDADTANNMEGVIGAFSDNTQTSQFRRTDGNLNADFPGKNGTGNTTITLCCWIRPSNISALGYIATKYRASTNERSWQLFRNDSGGNDIVFFSIGYNGGASAETVNLGSQMTLVATQKYHVGVSYDGSTKAWIIRGWDVTAGMAYTASGTMTNVMSRDTEDLKLFTGGAQVSNFRGTIDEVVIWNRALSVAEIDQVRNATFGAPAAGDEALMFGSDF